MSGTVYPTRSQLGDLRVRRKLASRVGAGLQEKAILVLSKRDRMPLATDFALFMAIENTESNRVGC